MSLTEYGSYKFMKFFNNKSAFTLAEVLITLGIIGVVAAMTIPGLIANIKNAHHRIAYRKAYSSLNQAIKYLQEEGVSLELKKDAYIGPDGTEYNYSVGKIFVELSKYYNAKTTCFDNNADKCWVCEKGEAGYINGTGAPDWLGCDKSSYTFIDASGVAYHLYRNVEFPIIIDVNGTTAPNQLGRDRFVLKFSDSLNPNVIYPDSSIDSVLPWVDVIEKQRWCPQGDCLYKSWIMKSNR